MASLDQFLLGGWGEVLRKPLKIFFLKIGSQKVGI